MLIIFTCISKLWQLDVLRVLSEQTLEISEEVKDSSLHDPSLAKVVKDSTLTILFQSSSSSCIFGEDGCNCWEFFAERAHCSVKDSVEILSSDWGCLRLTKGDFPWNYTRFPTSIFIYFHCWANFMREGALGV
jgi:hypothetical protein